MIRGHSYSIFNVYACNIEFLAMHIFGECPAGANVVENGKHHGLLPPADAAMSGTKRRRS
jgi:hypothetical protein